MDVEEASTYYDEYKTDCLIHYNDYTQYSLVLARSANLVKEEGGGNNNKMMHSLLEHFISKHCQGRNVHNDDAGK